MSKISLEGNVSGSGTLTISAPNTNSNFTLSLPTNTGTIITQNSTPAFASTIGVGGATAAASGAGITFPAAVSASSDANTLDDYEEGDWTPTDASGASLTFTSVNATYTKIGNQVIARFVLVYPSTASGATSLIGGLPFTVANNQSARQGVVTWADESTLAYFLPTNNNTNFSPRDFSGNTIANSVLSGNQMFGTIIYPV